MDSKNVIAAIALSSAVIVLYSLFFIPEQPKQSQNIDEKKIEQNTDTPSLEQKETIIQISREDALHDTFIKETEVDEIYFVSMNDPYVMDAWWKSMKIKKCKYLPDGNGALSMRIDSQGGIVEMWMIETAQGMEG